MFEICSTSLVALIRNLPLFCNFPLRFCNFPMSTNDVEQISNNRVINQESHVYFVKFGINLPRSFFKIFKSPSLCSGRFQKFQKTNSVNLSQISRNHVLEVNSSILKNTIIFRESSERFDVPLLLIFLA